MARGPSRRSQWDSNPQPLNTCMSRGAGSTTELSPTPTIIVGNRWKVMNYFVGFYPISDLYAVNVCMLQGFTLARPRAIISLGLWFKPYALSKACIGLVSLSWSFLPSADHQSVNQHTRWSCLSLYHSSMFPFLIGWLSYLLQASQTVHSIIGVVPSWSGSGCVALWLAVWVW